MPRRAIAVSAIGLLLAACDGIETQPKAALATAPSASAASAEQVNVSGARMAAAADVVQLCQSTMPDSKAFQARLKDKGYRFEGIANGFRILSRDNRNLIAFASTPASRNTGCGVTFRNMTADQGIQLAQPWLKATGAEQIPLENTKLRAGAAWDGIFKGTAVRIAVLPNQNLGIMRGTVLLAAENK